MKFEMVGEIFSAKTIAQGNGICDLDRLRTRHGIGKVILKIKEWL
jgi:hypothetical protein